MRFYVATKSRVLYIRIARSGRVYAGGRHDVILGLADMADGWTRRARAEQILAQARNEYPLSDLEIVQENR